MNQQNRQKSRQRTNQGGNPNYHQPRQYENQIRPREMVQIPSQLQYQRNFPNVPQMNQVRKLSPSPNRMKSQNIRGPHTSFVHPSAMIKDKSPVRDIRKIQKLDDLADYLRKAPKPFPLSDSAMILSIFEKFSSFYPYENILRIYIYFFIHSALEENIYKTFYSLLTKFNSKDNNDQNFISRFYNNLFRIVLRVISDEFEFAIEKLKDMDVRSYWQIQSQLREDIMGKPRYPNINSNYASIRSVLTLIRKAMEKEKLPQNNTPSSQHPIRKVLKGFKESQKSIFQKIFLEKGQSEQDKNQQNQQVFHLLLISEMSLIIHYKYKNLVSSEFQQHLTQITIRKMKLSQLESIFEGRSIQPNKQIANIITLKEQLNNYTNLKNDHQKDFLYNLFLLNLSEYNKTEGDDTLLGKTKCDFTILNFYLSLIVKEYQASSNFISAKIQQSETSKNNLIFYSSILINYGTLQKSEINKQNRKTNLYENYVKLCYLNIVNNLFSYMKYLHSQSENSQQQLPLLIKITNCLCPYGVNIKTIRTHSQLKYRLFGQNTSQQNIFYQEFKYHLSQNYQQIQKQILKMREKFLRMMQNSHKLGNIVKKPIKPSLQKVNEIILDSSFDSRKIGNGISLNESQINDLLDIITQLYNKVYNSSNGNYEETTLNITHLLDFYCYQLSLIEYQKYLFFIGNYRKIQELLSQSSQDIKIRKNSQDQNLKNVYQQNQMQQQGLKAASYQKVFKKLLQIQKNIKHYNDIIKNLIKQIVKRTGTISPAQSNHIKSNLKIIFSNDLFSRVNNIIVNKNYINEYIIDRIKQSQQDIFNFIDYYMSGQSNQIQYVENDELKEHIVVKQAKDIIDTIEDFVNSLKEKNQCPPDNCSFEKQVQFKISQAFLNKKLQLLKKQIIEKKFPDFFLKLSEIYHKSIKPQPLQILYLNKVVSLSVQKLFIYLFELYTCTFSQEQFHSKINKQYTNHEDSDNPLARILGLPGAKSFSKQQEKLKQVEQLCSTILETVYFGFKDIQLNQQNLEKPQILSLQSLQQLLVNKLKKCISLFYDKFTDHMIKTFVINQNMFILRCIVVTSYKIKSLCETIWIKLGLFEKIEENKGTRNGQIKQKDSNIINQIFFVICDQAMIEPYIKFIYTKDKIYLRHEILGLLNSDGQRQDKNSANQQCYESILSTL